MLETFQAINTTVAQFVYTIAAHNIYTEYVAIFLSDGIFVLSIGVYILVVFPLRKKGSYSRTLWRDLAPAVLAGVVALISKYTSHIARPFVVLGIEPFVSQPDPYGSFPSWHLAVFTAFSFTLVQHHRKLGIFFVSLVPFVALGRIAIGVHWLSDVCVGVFMGAIVAYRIPIQNAKHRASDYVVKKVFEQKRVQDYIEKKRKRV